MKKMSLCLSVAAIAVALFQVSVANAQGKANVPSMSVSEKGIFFNTPEGSASISLPPGLFEPTGDSKKATAKSVTTKSNGNATSGASINRSAGVSTGGKCVNGVLRVIASGMGDSSYSKLSCDRVELVLTNMGNLTVGEVAAQTVSINSSGMGNIKISKLGTERLDVDSSAQGDVTVNQGNAATLNVILGDMGNLDARGLISQNVKARLSSTGSARVFADRSIEADLSGMGDLIYKGGATVVSANASDMGTVKKM